MVETLFSFVSVASGVLAGKPFSFGELIAVSIWVTDTGDTHLVPLGAFDNGGVFTPGDSTAGFGTRGVSFGYCDTTVTFGGITLLLGVSLAELVTIPAYRGLTLPGKITLGVELWMSDLEFWTEGALVGKVTGGIVDDVGGSWGLPCIAGIICGLMA